MYDFVAIIHLPDWPDGVKNVNELQTKSAYSMALERATEEEIMKTLCNSLYPGAKVESVKMVLAYCKASGLDPLMKPVHIVPMYVKIAGTDKGEMRDVIMPGVGLYRIQASRTGVLAGISEPEFGPSITMDLSGVSVTFPEWCRVTVKRLMPGGNIAEFVAKEFWLENYATAGKDTQKPNSMWMRRTFGQIAKCAEAQALRKACPEVGQQPTAEEMEGKELELNDAPPRRQSSRAADQNTITDVDPETGEVIKSEKKPEPEKLPPWPDDRFNENMPTWTKVIESKKKTAAEVIATIETKGTLTDEQRKRILDLENVKND